MARTERSLRDWLDDIVEWGDRMADYVEGMDEAAFIADRKTQDAVVRCLECSGEASRQAVAAGHSERFEGVEFVDAYWTRNRLAHGYYDVNAVRVWATATGAVPPFVAKVRDILRVLPR